VGGGGGRKAFRLFLFLRFFPFSLRLDGGNPESSLRRRRMAGNEIEIAHLIPRLVNSSPQPHIRRWGGGMYGKLGHGNESGHSTPRRVETLVGLVVVDIACGSRHTAVITNKGCLYTWGDKENGVAGHGDTEGHQYTPKLLERLSGKKVVQLSACGFHTGCLTDMGEVYTWGEGKFGRLGHGAERNCHSPRLVETLLGKRPIQIACGGFHSAVVTQDGKMYTFGGGEHGQLGHGDKVNRVKPTLVQALDGIFLKQITCGWSHSVALTSEGEVYTWGNGDHGKLGHGNGKKVSTPQLLGKLVGQNVVRVASYNEHTACLVEPHSVTQGGSRRAAPGTMIPISAAFLHDMKEMVNDEEYSDVAFIVEGRPVYALRSILAKRCDHFAAMFRSGSTYFVFHPISVVVCYIIRHPHSFLQRHCRRLSLPLRRCSLSRRTVRECEEGAEIPIPNMSHAVFLLILEYLYTDSVKIELEHAVELYIASDIYQLATLRDMCCVVVRRSVGSENATHLLQTAHEAHCQVMKDIAMEYIVANFDVISKSEGIKAVSHSLLLEILSLRP
jgi:RCC1 and BTB domain-containing protein